MAAEPRVRSALSALQAKMESFRDLLDVDWVIDIAEMKDAQIGKAISKYLDNYTDHWFGDTEIDPGPIKQIPPEQLGLSSSLARYRNYLRAIYTGPTNSANYDVRKQALQTRFHQNFAATSTVEVPANQILISIVKSILTAPTGSGFGFGMSIADIPAQGQKSNREYLDDLIALTNLSARELGLRYRIDLQRPDSALSSAVGENIATLQGFYRDGFHSKLEPYYNTLLYLDHKQPAPFFLHYDEWVRHNEVSFPENTYQITEEFTSGVAPELRERVESLAAQNQPETERDEITWVLALTDIEDEMNNGHRAFGLGQYAIAMDHYETAFGMADEALDFYTKHAGWIAEDNEQQENEGDVILRPIESYLGIHPVYQNVETFDSWFDDQRWKLRLRLLYLLAYVLPACKGDVAFAMGDYPTAATHYAGASRFRVGRAEIDSAAYHPDDTITIPTLSVHAGHDIHLDGGLPYSFDPKRPDYGAGPITRTGIDPLSFLSDYDWGENTFDPCSRFAWELRNPTLTRFCKLRHGNALLEWADALYRTDERASIARARELYKAVLSLHGSKAPISPKWSSVSYDYTDLYDTAAYFLHHTPNPAVTSQKARALRGFKQIELGLNYYGVQRDFVPALRYRPLKDAADRFAATAKAAQQDFLAYMGKVEDAIREGLLNANMLKKATLQGNIADEQAKVAEYNVMVAEQQVEQIEAAIEAKEQEIQDEDAFDIVGEFVGGMADSVTGLIKQESSAAAAGAGAATSGLGATTATMSAYGMIVYAYFTTVTSMIDAREKRSAELNALRNTALPMAEANLKARQAEATIVKLQKQVAEADAELASALVKFQAGRTLNIDFWASVVTMVRRMMRRYLELGARFAWLAEQALEYEQDRPINVVRFDYFPRKLQGVTGADLLQLDLAELEASRLDGTKRTMPVKHTYSMMSDFPLQFAQLKKHGRCTFQTTELPFRYAYPGTYGYRVVALSVAIKGITGAIPVRGLLRNRGISLLSRDNGEAHVSVRFPDAFPLSEFRLREDMAIYSLPDDALMSFEGSGVESFWELTFPALANPYGLDQVADIQLTFDARASYSPGLYEEHIETAPSSVNRFVFFSARKHNAQSLAALQDTAQNAPATVDVVFDPAQFGLSQHESNRVVKNLVLLWQARRRLRCRRHSVRRVRTG